MAFILKIWWYSKQASKGIYVYEYIDFYKQTLYDYVPISACFISNVSKTRFCLFLLFL